MKHKPIIVAIILCLVGLSVVPAAPARAASPQAGFNVLEMSRDSDILTFNGEPIKAAQPVTYVNGSAYIPLKSVASIFGFKTGYDGNTKEAVVKSGTLELRFKGGSSSIRVNGEVVQANGAAFVQNGVMMVPVRTWANATGSRLELSGGTVKIRWNANVKPSAAFEIEPGEIHAGQTQVVYTDKASHPAGLPIVEEVWEGRYDIFPEAGLYTVSRRVMDANGNWSDPYEVTVNVLPPNLPPVADFTTDKTSYRIGETIRYTDLSRDDEDAIVRRTWTGNETVFFEPGEKRVELEVEDKHGLTHRVVKTITVTEEVLYTKYEYDKLFTGIGEKYEVPTAAALGYEPVEFTFTKEDVRLLKSNSPEFLKTTGIAFDTVQRGNVRFLIYNQSSLSFNAKMYLVATNINSSAVYVDIGSYGVGGPANYSATAGKMSTIRYLEAVSRGTTGGTVRIAPKQSVILLADQLSAVPIKPNQVISAYADLHSTDDLRYRIVVVPEDVDPLAALETLPLMARDGVHVRGTFGYANRIITIDEQLGQTKQRLVFGDGKYDPYLYGLDDGTGLQELSHGNYGVLYRIKVRVAPRTLISLNPRGGHYTGGFVVNGRVVEVTKGSILKNQGEAAVLYRTGILPETIEILFTPANGSNLPITLLFEPLPEVRS